MTEIQHFEASIEKNEGVSAAEVEKLIGFEVEVESLSEYKGDREEIYGVRYLVGLPVGSPEFVELETTGYLAFERGGVKVEIEQ